jgi:hypothetical protein
MKPAPKFPTIWFRGNTAFFKLSSQWVRVPLQFTARLKKEERHLHVIPWLRSLWPLRVKKGILVKVTNGHEVALHRVYCAAVHSDIGFDFSDVTAVDGDFLHWTPENIQPVRNPNAPATDKAKLYEVARQLRLGTTEGGSRLIGQKYYPDSSEQYVTRSLLRRDQRVRDEFVDDIEAIVTPAQLEAIRLVANTTLTTSEKELVATQTRGDSERVNHEEHDEWSLSAVTEETLSLDETPAKSAYKNPSLKDNGEPVAPVPDEEIRPTPLREVQTSAATDGHYQTFSLVSVHEPAMYPSISPEVVEWILNHYGWFRGSVTAPFADGRTRTNPVFEGRDSTKVLRRTSPVVFPPRRLPVLNLQAEPKVYYPSPALPVRAVPYGPVPPDVPLKGKVHVIGDANHQVTYSLSGSLPRNESGAYISDDFYHRYLAPPKPLTECSEWLQNRVVEFADIVAARKAKKVSEVTVQTTDEEPEEQAEKEVQLTFSKKVRIDLNFTFELERPSPTRLRPDVDTGCGCFAKMSFPRLGIVHLPSCPHAPVPDRRLVTVLDIHGFATTMPIAKSKKLISDMRRDMHEEYRYSLVRL